MDSINTISIVIGILGTIVAIYATLRNYYREDARGSKADSYHNASIRLDLDYIKKRSDDNMLALKEINSAVSDINERVARIEERANEAHKRIDRLEF